MKSPDLLTNINLQAKYFFHFFVGMEASAEIDVFKI